MKEIKLFLLNYNHLVEKFGEEEQKILHAHMFDIVLQLYHNGVISTRVKVKGGELYFVEAVDFEGKMILKYFYKYY